MRTFMNHSINFTNFEWNITENLYTLNQLPFFSLENDNVTGKYR